MFRRTISIITILVALGIAGVYAYPKYEKIQTLRAEQETLNDALDTAQRIEKLTQDLEENMAEISEQERNTLTQLLPETVDRLAIFNDLSGVARTNNVRMDNIVFDAGDAESDSGNGETKVVLPTSDYFIAIPITFSVTGDYEDLLAFLTDVERSVQLFDVVQVNLETSGQGSGAAAPQAGSSYSFNITAATYRLKTP